MQNLNNADYKLYKSVIMAREKPLLKTVTSFLKKKYDEVIERDTFVMAVGTIPIALVAHLDTVFENPPSNVYYDREQGVIWSPEGGCGDDRAGVFAILKLIMQGFRPTVIFTLGEEIGGLGASKVVTEYQQPLTELKYIIELDRRGSTDCVFYDCNNEEFVEFIESYGFIENFGSFSDISIICPVWGVAGVNLSIGYEDEHSFSEIVRTKPMLKTISKVAQMLKDANEASVYKYIPSPYPNGLFMNYLMDKMTGTEQCAVCGKHFNEYELIPVEDYDDIHYYCPDCCADSNKVGWCAKCGSAFKKENPQDKFCYICR